MEMFFMSIKVVGVLIFVIILMLLTLRLSENKLNNKKNIKVLDKAQLSKDNSIYILKILNKGYVVSVSSSKTDILSELSEDEIEEILQEKEKMQFYEDEFKRQEKEEEEALAKAVDEFNSRRLKRDECPHCSSEK